MENLTLISSLFIFMLACFTGFEIIKKIPPTLHTPLMSGANAISGIVLVGAIVITADHNQHTTLLGFLAIIFATVNVVGGFMVTDRMLSLFKKRSKK